MQTPRVQRTMDEAGGRRVVAVCRGVGLSASAAVCRLTTWPCVGVVDTVLGSRKTCDVCACLQISLRAPLALQCLGRCLGQSRGRAALPRRARRGAR